MGITGFLIMIVGFIVLALRRWLEIGRTNQYGVVEHSGFLSFVSHGFTQGVLKIVEGVLIVGGLLLLGFSMMPAPPGGW